jgi:lysyl-tRNA synthetase class I
MRNWIEGAHFPDGARIRIQGQISEENKQKLTGQQKLFLSELSSEFESCEWTENKVNELIRDITMKIGIGRREGYVALYLLILGTDYGPRIASIITELSRKQIMQIFSKSL